MKDKIRKKKNGDKMKTSIRKKKNWRYENKY
jgi:hypothetical protein